ncbi:MAG: DEAD/DEAH box helicase family protein [Candidatus Heimdallarchaeota archaeon]|nr:MAG: DEAD/DEAH box helicase family protein [Candidatus Heimdallarchaeota archaeon]
MSSNNDSVIQRREYQRKILKILEKNFVQGKHTLVEVDTGLGKRVLTYLLIKETLLKKRILLLLHSTTSYLETIQYFKTEYGDFSESEFQPFSSRTPTWLRKSSIENARIIATTPQTFFNVFNKMSNKPKFDVVIINEVDKIVRRQGDSRLLIFPYNTLIPYFVNSNAWIVGMTGTMRDSHILYIHQRNTIEVQPEIISLDQRIPGLHVIRMETLLAQTDIEDYIKTTYIQRHPVEPSSTLQTILDLIDQGIKELRNDIIEETLVTHPTLLETIPSSQLALVSGMLESGKRAQKYQGLLLIRKYCTAMQAPKYRRFLYRLKKFGVTKEIIRTLPEESNKVKTVWNLIKQRPENSKTVILCSFLDTAHLLHETIPNFGFPSFLITGQVRNKGEVLNDFKNCRGSATLVLTSVGERDIDIPQAQLLIVYDSINTVKTMYQRMKRTRGGLVLCLYYQGTFEERKVGRLLYEISERYPWSSIID